MTAQMTAQSPGDRRIPMKRERDAAIRTVPRFTAFTAKERRRKSTPIQKQNRLFAFLQTIGNCLRQFFRKYCSFLFFPSFLAKIDDAHERHLLLIYTLCQDHESILAGRGVVITLERRRGASENNSAFLDLR